jgi:hypothetical protein
MQGLFEIHVSVDPKDMLKFRLWSLDNDLKAIGILGDVPELTFSKYTNGTKDKALAKALSLARNLTASGIHVTRVRIEAIFSKVDVEINNDAENNADGYFEFHVKYHIVNSTDYLSLDKIAKEFTTKHSEAGIYSFVGFNSFKKNVEPIITLRVPSVFKIEGAIHFKDQLMTTLKTNGFRTNEEIHREYVFLDQEYSKL